MRRLLYGLFLFVLFSLCCSSPIFALDVPKRAEGYVSDYARILSGSARQRLEQVLKGFEEKTSNQVLVATFPRLEGDALESFSIRLAEAWKPGQKGKDNGVILLVFKEDRKVRIEVGYGLEGVLTDALCRLIIENEIAPRFRAGDYDGGIEHGVAAILSATRGEYHAPPHSGGLDGGSFRQLISLGLLAALFLPGWVLCLAGIFGSVAAVVTGTALFGVLGAGLLVLGGLSFFIRPVLLGGFSNSSGLSGRGYYSGYGSGGFGGFGGGFGGGGGGFSGGGGGFGGGGAGGSW